MLQKGVQGKTLYPCLSGHIVSAPMRGKVTACETFDLFGFVRYCSLCTEYFQTPRYARTDNPEFMAWKEKSGR